LSGFFSLAKFGLFDVASNVQQLQVLARLLGLLEHSLLGTKTQLSDLLINSLNVAGM
jgi:hypothetical protein